MHTPLLHTTFLFLFYLALSLNSGYCNTDFCDGDPRIRTVENKCPGNKQSILLQFRPYRNPHHALHDFMWGFSHYLQNCARGEVTFFSKYPPKDIKQCLNRSHIDPRTIPEWGICVGVAMIEELGSNYSFKFESEEKLLNGSMKTCYRIETIIGLKPEENGYVDTHRNITRKAFRGVTWFGRNTTGKTGAKYDEYSLIRLPEEFKVNAFQFIKDAVYNKYGISHRRREPYWNAKAEDTKIRVLVYDRNDTDRRQWVNPSVITQALDMIEDVDYKFVRSIPKPFIDQVELFSWADIVIAPHGAAMANTIFMKEGTDIIETWKYCLHKVSRNPKRPREWTGWHAYLLGINLTYVQCHTATLASKESKELVANQVSDMDRPHKVRGGEILGVFREALERQRAIIRNKVKKELRRQRFGRISETNGTSIGGSRGIVFKHLQSTEELMYLSNICLIFALLSLLFRIRVDRKRPRSG